MMWVILCLASYPVVIMLFMPILNKNKMKKQEALREEYLKTLKINNKVVTMSGIYGNIKSIDGNIVKLEIAKNLEIEIAKESIIGTIK